MSSLIYNNKGDSILALGSNAIHIVWKWRRNHLNKSGTVKRDIIILLVVINFNNLHLLKVDNATMTGILIQATTRVPPQLWKPSRPQLIGHYSKRAKHADSVACFVFSRNDAYGISTSGGRIAVFNMLAFKVT